MAKKPIKVPNKRLFMRVDFRAIKARVLALVTGSPKPKFNVKGALTGRTPSEPEMQLPKGSK